MPVALHIQSFGQNIELGEQQTPVVQNMQIVGLAAARVQVQVLNHRVLSDARLE